MTSTDVGAQISAWIAGKPRETIIHTHGIPVPLAFWDDIADLPGAPLTGEPMRNGSVRIDRGQLFTFARSVQADETGAAALRLLWHVLAWGSDTRNWRHHHPANHRWLLPRRMGRRISDSRSAWDDRARRAGLLIG